MSFGASQKGEKMKLKLILPALAVLALLSAIPAAAQTYTQTVPKTCLASGYYPVSLLSQFNCSGITYPGSVSVYLNRLEFEVFTPSWAIPSLNSEITVTAFTLPVGTTPGTISLTWTGTDTNGVEHNGSFNAQWTETKRGAWYYPIVQTSTLVISQ
jgi:hypothetical protein